MACPLCGDRCTCSAAGNRFAGEHTAVLIDPDNNFSSDLSERQFASSLESTPQAAPRRTSVAVGQNATATADPAFYRPDPGLNPGEAWRDEVAVRVQAHKARRRRRFDPDGSLSLGFDPQAALAAEPVAEAEESSPARTAAPRMYRRIALEMQAMEAMKDAAATEAALAVESVEASAPHSEPETNIIEFPRAYTQTEDMFAHELAEPMLESPRILDVPDEPALAPVTANYPTLSNICLDTDDDKEVPEWIRNYRDEYDEAELELPLQVAPLRSRFVSAVIDSALVLTATALFCVVVLSITKFMPQGKPALLTAIVLSATFWLAYHYAFLVFSGLTPGMQVAQLELCSFEGCYPLRKTRGARAFAMGISGMSLGMGFAWAAVDEDNLGWHDRITRTYVRQS
ncbi:MAG TPA: RDD family protein [Terriglobales bacterium]|nr:RDD family protein [Terriglobales bacterium]